IVFHNVLQKAYKTQKNPQILRVFSKKIKAVPLLCHGSLCKESINRIDVNVDGRRVGFDFPDNNFEKIDTMEKLYKYFKFEKRQISTGEKAE
ncbi:MAG: hypothetical protein II292_00915, partial [Clostridia bacterium]|nr:hypothetical protein [Clostridia bacterium]